MRPYRTTLPDRQPAWLITRYEDVVMVLKDDARFTKDRNAAMSAEQLARTPWIPPMFKPLMRTILDTDGVEHTRLRGLIHKAFTPRLIEQMRERVQRLSNELLYAAERRGKMDLIRDYALPVPLTIIAEILGITEKGAGQRCKINGGATEHQRAPVIPRGEGHPASQRESHDAVRAGCDREGGGGDETRGPRSFLLQRPSGPP
jgi:cytochrome P450